MTQRYAYLWDQALKDASQVAGDIVNEAMGEWGILVPGILSPELRAGEKELKKAKKILRH
ncbi:MAG: hypothetical protein HN366_18840 [Deltaproteobacteria bacterium]|jgi:hypothetical protein|nr:hypothetical protein [Deltaproteobacteria bacterium]